MSYFCWHIEIKNQNPKMNSTKKRKGFSFGPDLQEPLNISIDMQLIFVLALL